MVAVRVRLLKKTHRTPDDNTYNLRFIARKEFNIATALQYRESSQTKTAS